VPDGSAGPAFRRWDRWTYPVLLLPLLGVAGVHFSLRLNVALYLLTKVLALYAALRSRAAGRATATPEWLSVLFLLSGLAALIYQIAWQRVLFVAFGVDIESVTIIVSAFLLGLGVGSLAGGYLSTFASWPLPRLFLLCELGIGLFGLASIPLIQATAAATRGGGRWSVSLAVFSLLVIPTTFMGATLPILVTHVHRWYRNVGQSVALLYSLNTLGSALASLLTVYLLFAYVGLQTSVTIAAGFNFLVGGLVYRYAKALEPTGAG